MDLSKAKWRKASYSADNQGDCVEVASVPATVAIRDSKDPQGPMLFMSRDQARSLARAVKSI